MSNKSNGEPLEVLTAKLEKNLSEWQRILSDIKAQKVLLPELQARMDALQSSLQHQQEALDTFSHQLQTSSRSHTEELELLRQVFLQIPKPENDLQQIRQEFDELKATTLHFQLQQVSSQQQGADGTSRILQMELEYKKSIAELDNQNKDLLARMIRQEEEIGLLFHKEKIQKKAINTLSLTIGIAIFSGIVYLLLKRLFWIRSLNYSNIYL